jgi:hypothetical protein
VDGDVGRLPAVGVGWRTGADAIAAEEDVNESNLETISEDAGGAGVRGVVRDDGVVAGTLRCKSCGKGEVCPDEDSATSGI